MADYTVIWSDIPLEQYWALPEQARQLVNDRILELRPNPIRDLETYNRDTDHWTVDYGGGAGLLPFGHGGPVFVDGSAASRLRDGTRSLWTPGRPTSRPSAHISRT